jgi:sugar-specific transcriptional regulator TrmB
VGVVFAQDESRIQTLRRLGLTQYQGMTFLVLVEFGVATAKDITKKTGIPRPKVYEALDDLHELGIANKMMTTPATFEAIPLGAAVSFLMGRKLNDYQSLRSETSSLLRAFDQRTRGASRKEPKISLVSAKDAVVDCMQRLVAGSVVSVDLVTSWRRFSKMSLFSSALVKAQDRGVKLRVVVERPRNGIVLSEHIRSVGLPSFAEYRTRLIAPTAVIGLFDGKHVLICTKADAELADSPAMVTDNACFVEVAKAYFQKMWLTSQPYKERPMPNAEVPSLFG